MTQLSNGTIVTDIDATHDNTALTAQGYTIRAHRDLARPRHHLHPLGRAADHRGRPALLRGPRPGRPARVGPLVMYTPDAPAPVGTNRTRARTRLQGQAASAADPKRSASAATRPRPAACLLTRVPVTPRKQR